MYHMMKSFYGKRFHLDKPDIRIQRTFEEDVYVTFITKDRKGMVKEETHYFDLTIMGLLSPITLDDTDRWWCIWKQCDEL